MKYVLPALAAMALLAGCTASLNGSVTPGSGTTGATGSTGSTGATGSTSVGATVGTGSLNPVLAKMYTVGRKWEYVTTNSAPATTTTEQREVTAVNGTKATVKSTIAGNVSTYDVDLTQKDVQSAAAASASSKATYTIDAAQTRSEKVTVMAGSFDSTHFAGSVKVDTGVSNSSSTFEQWVNDTQGLLKLVTKTHVDIAAAVPSGVTLPPGFNLPTGGASGSSDVTTTIELKSFQ